MALRDRIKQRISGQSIPSSEDNSSQNNTPDNWWDRLKQDAGQVTDAVRSAIKQGTSKESRQRLSSSYREKAQQAADKGGTLGSIGLGVRGVGKAGKFLAQETLAGLSTIGKGALKPIFGDRFDDPETERRVFGRETFPITDYYSKPKGYLKDIGAPKSAQILGGTLGLGLGVAVESPIGGPRRAAIQKISKELAEQTSRDIVGEILEREFKGITSGQYGNALIDNVTRETDAGQIARLIANVSDVEGQAAKTGLRDRIQKRIAQVPIRGTDGRFQGSVSISPDGYTDEAARIADLSDVDEIERTMRRDLNLGRNTRQFAEGFADETDPARVQEVIDNAVQEGGLVQRQAGEDLVAIHNASAANVDQAIESGGFAAPSIAVTRSGIPLENFGEASFIFNRRVVDPSDPNVRAYLGDTYTAQTPRPEYNNTLDELFNSDRYAGLRKRLDDNDVYWADFNKDTDRDDFIRRLTRNDAFNESEATSLADEFFGDPVVRLRNSDPEGELANLISENPSIRQIFDEASSWEDMRIRLMNDDQAVRLINDRAERLGDDFVYDAGSEFVEANNNYFRLLREGFERDLDYNNADNVVEAMKRQVREGTTDDARGVAPFTPGRIFAYDEVNNLDDLRASKDLFEEEDIAKAAGESLSDDYDNLLDDLGFIEERATREQFTEDIFTRGIYDRPEDIKRLTDETDYYPDLTLEEARQAGEAADRAFRQAKRQYAEVKPMRTVRLDEAEGVAIPDSWTDEQVQRLYDNGITRIERYGPEAGQTRQEAVDKLSQNNLFAGTGAVAGIEVDEEGNLSFDVTKATIGLLGFAGATRAYRQFAHGGNPFKQVRAWRNHPNFPEAEGQVLTEMDFAEAGERIAITDGAGGTVESFASRPSSFPSWAPEGTRSRALFDRVKQMYLNEELPAKNATKQQELLDAMTREIGDRMGVTTDYPDVEDLARNTENVDDLLKEWNENQDKLMSLSKEVVNGRYSNLTFDGFNQATRELDTVNKIPNPPKQAQLGVTNGEVNPRFDIPDETLLRYIQRQVQDKMNRLKTVQESVVRQAGDDLPDSLDAYLQQELYVGRAAERIDDARRALIFNDQKGGKALLERIREDDITLEEMGDFLHARHAKERNAKVRSINEDLPDAGSGMPDAEADRILSNYGSQHPIYQYADEFRDKVIDTRLRILEEEDLMTPESIQMIKDSYDNYVPLKVEQKSNFWNTGKGYSITGKDVQRVKGSTKERTNPVVQAIVDLEETIIRAEKNKVAKTLDDFVNRYPDPNIWKSESLQYTPRFNSEGELQYMDPNFKLADNVMQVRRNGKIKLVTIEDEALANAMKNMGTTHANKVLRSVNGYLRAVNTYYNPEFMLTNFERDLQTALINIGGEQSGRMAKNVARDIRKSMRGVYRGVRGKNDFIDKDGFNWSQAYKEMKEEGGRVGWFDMDPVSTRTQETIKLIERYNSDKTTDAFMRSIDQLGRYIGDMNESVEMAARLSAYKNAVDEGVSKQRAAQLAKNLTVNFNKKGNLGVMLDSLYLFANAGIQGGARIITALRHPNVRKIAYATVAATYGINVLNNNINPEQYERISDYEKDHNLIFMLPPNMTAKDFDAKVAGIEGNDNEGYYLKLRLPYGYNIFKIMGDIAYDQATRRKTVGEGVKRLIVGLDSAFNPLSSGTLLQLGSPTITDPLVQQLENKSWYGGPIKPEQGKYEKQKPESEKFFRTAREASVGVARWLNDVTGGSDVESGAVDISPEIIDHYVDFLGGGVGRLTGNTVNMGTTLSTGDLPGVENMPFIRNIIGRPNERSETFEIYDLLGKSETNKLGDIEVQRFKDDIKYAIQNEQIDEDTAFKYVEEFRENQATIEAAEYLDKYTGASSEEKKEAFNKLDPMTQEQLPKLIEDRAERDLEEAE